MKCSRCGGEMEERIVRFCVSSLTPPIMIENVPARVCTRCGGEVFSDSTLDVFETIRDGRVPHRIASVRVFDFEAVRLVDGASVAVATDGNGSPRDNVVVDAGTMVGRPVPVGVSIEEPYEPAQPGTRARPISYV